MSLLIETRSLAPPTHPLRHLLSTWFNGQPSTWLSGGFQVTITALMAEFGSAIEADLAKFRQHFHVEDVLAERTALKQIAIRADSK